MKKIPILFIFCLVLKIANAQSPSLIWAKGIGGAGEQEGKSICIDTKSNVYMAGTFQGVVDFDPGSGIYNLTSAGNFDICISKLDKDGNFLWARSIGGIPYELVNAAELDLNDNIIITGTFSGTVDFDPSSNIFNLTSVGGAGYILKLDENGDFLWAKKLGASVYANSFKLDSTGNLYTTGVFSGTSDFDPGTNVYNLSASGIQDAFILKLDSIGNFVWAKTFGGNSTASGLSIAVSKVSTNLYVIGKFKDTVDFDPDSSAVYSLSSNGNEDIFVLKLDITGDFIWAKSIGSSSFEIGYSIDLDPLDNAYLTGEFYGSVDFDPGIGNYNINSTGNSDIFLLKLNSFGDFIWANHLPGIFHDGGRSIKVDKLGNVYSTGKFVGSVDFDPGIDLYILKSFGQEDAYILKLDSSGNFRWAKSFGGTQFEIGLSINIDPSDNVYTTGSYGGVADFDSDSSSTYKLTALDSKDIYIVKYGYHVLGSNEIFKNNEVSIYPNPTNGNLVIKREKQFKNASITIRNFAGQLLYKQNKVNSNQLNFDISTQANGLYLVEINEGGKQDQFKIVKQ